MLHCESSTSTSTGGSSQLHQLEALAICLVQAHDTNAHQRARGWRERDQVVGVIKQREAKEQQQCQEPRAPQQQPLLSRTAGQTRSLPGDRCQQAADGQQQQPANLPSQLRIQQAERAGLPRIEQAKGHQEGGWRERNGAAWTVQRARSARANAESAVHAVIAQSQLQLRIVLCRDDVGALAGWCSCQQW